MMRMLLLKSLSSLFSVSLGFSGGFAGAFVGEFEGTNALLLTTKISKKGDGDRRGGAADRRQTQVPSEAAYRAHLRGSFPQEHVVDEAAPEEMATPGYKEMATPKPSYVVVAPSPKEQDKDEEVPREAVPEDREDVPPQEEAALAAPPQEEQQEEGRSPEHHVGSRISSAAEVASYRAHLRGSYQAPSQAPSQKLAETGTPSQKLAAGVSSLPTPKPWWDDTASPRWKDWPPDFKELHTPGYKENQPSYKERLTPEYKEEQRIMSAFLKSESCVDVVVFCVAVVLPCTWFIGLLRGGATCFFPSYVGCISCHDGVFTPSWNFHFCVFFWINFMGLIFLAYSGMICGAPV